MYGLILLALSFQIVFSFWGTQLVGFATGLGWRAVGVIRLAVPLASCETTEGYIFEILPERTHQVLVS